MLLCHDSALCPLRLVVWALNRTWGEAALAQSLGARRVGARWAQVRLGGSPTHSRRQLAG